jgi:DHA1 family tetracycline resistance protein-like MFS transporter
MGSRVGVLWLIVLIDLIGFGLTSPTIPLVLKDSGASPFWVTFAGPGVYSLFQFVCTPIWSRMSDAYGRRPILMISMIGAVASYLLLAFADTTATVIVARALGGIMSGNLGAAFAYVADVTEPKDRAKGLGILSSAFGFGFMLGPVIGGFLATMGGAEVSLRYPALASAALSGLAVLGVLVVLRESLPPEQRKALAVKGTAASLLPFAAVSGRPILLGLVLTALISSIAGSVMQSVYPLWARQVYGHNPDMIGIAYGVLAAMAVVSQAGLVGKLARLLNEKRVAMLGIAGLSVGVVIIGFLQHPWLLWVGLVLGGLGLGLITPSLSAMVSFQAEPRERGAMMGAYQSGNSLGRVIGPSFSGIMFVALGASAPYVATIALSCVALLMLARTPVRSGAQISGSGAPNEAAPPTANRTGKSQ